MRHNLSSNKTRAHIDTIKTPRDTSEKRNTAQRQVWFQDSVKEPKLQGQEAISCDKNNCAFFTEAKLLFSRGQESHCRDAPVENAGQKTRLNDQQRAKPTANEAKKLCTDLVQRLST